MPELRLKTRVDFDGSKFTAGLQNMARQAKTMVGPLKTITDSLRGIADSFGVGGILGGFGIAAAISKTISVITTAFSEAGALQDAVERSNLSAAKLKEITRVAENSGASRGEVLVFFKHIRQTQKEAVNGNEEMIASYAELGFTLARLKKIGFEQVFDELMGRTKGASFTDRTMSALSAIGGRSADNLIPFLKSGINSVGSDKTKDIGDTTEALDALGDMASDAGRKMKEVFSTVIGHQAKRVLFTVDLVSAALRRLRAARDKVLYGITPGSNVPAQKTFEGTRVDSSKDIQQAQKIAKLSKELNDQAFERRNATLTVEGRIAELKKKQVALEREANDLQSYSITADKAKVQADREKSLEKLLEAGKISKEIASMTPRRSTHQYQYSGGYTPSSNMMNAPAGLAQFEKVRDKFEKIEAAIREQTQVIRDKEGAF